MEVPFGRREDLITPDTTIGDFDPMRKPSSGRLDQPEADTSALRYR
jgi:hypothetical protein